MHEYQPLQINPFTDTLVGPDYEFTNIAELSTYNILKTLNAGKLVALMEFPIGF